jgi:hypothetical protein
MYVCMYVCMYVYKYIYVCMYVCIYVCVHNLCIYTHNIFIVCTVCMNVYALRCMYGMVWYGMQAANVYLHLNEVFVVLVLAEHHLLHILRQVVEEVSVDAAQLHTYIHSNYIALY